MKIMLMLMQLNSHSKEEAISPTAKKRPDYFRKHKNKELWFSRMVILIFEEEVG